MYDYGVNSLVLMFVKDEFFGLESAFRNVHEAFRKNARNQRTQAAFLVIIRRHTQIWAVGKDILTYNRFQFRIYLWIVRPECGKDIASEVFNDFLR